MDALIARRRVLKGRITRIETAALKHETQSLSVVEIDQHLDKLVNLRLDADTLENDFSTLCDETEADEQCSEFDSIDSRLTTLKVKLTGFKPQQQPTQAPVQSQSPAVTSADVKLPRMDLPKFSGNHLEWRSFRDLFTSIVHNNKKISDAQKLHYLKNSLEGEATGILQSIDVTDANYSEAWDLLTERYENERQLIYCHLKMIFTQSVLTTESSTQLRNLLDTTIKHVRALHALGIDTDQWDPVLLYVVCERLDKESRRQWELHSPGKQLPSFDQLKMFLEQRCRALEATGVSPKEESKVSYAASKSTKPYAVARTTTTVHHGSTKTDCAFCKGDHALFKCDSFIALSPTDRHSKIKNLRLCFNCLGSGHSVSNCKAGNCRKCGKRHHTLLHRDLGEAVAPGAADPSSVSTHFANSKTTKQVLLATALIQVTDGYNKTQVCRALLDNGSQASFISEACAQRLALHRQKTNITVHGLASAGIGNVRGSVQLQFTSCYIQEEKYNIAALVMSKITGMLPSYPVSPKSWPHVQSLKLADPQFYEPGNIDILLGADVYAQLVRNGRLSGPAGSPIALETALGWILMGQVQASKSKLPTSIANGHVITLHAQCGLESALKKFWEVEEIYQATPLTEEERLCEEHFQDTYARDNSGRFVVQLPFHKDSPDLGSSRDAALRRWAQVERRLAKYPDQKEEYNNFMKEYLDLGHMDQVPADETAKPASSLYYLPHHAVIKPSSTTTKLRVVFDASSKTSTGVSLNEKLMVGPKLQKDITPLLVKFRTHLIALTADIAKMYRQIRMHQSDADFQRIVWRESTDHPIKDYRLSTVTYGTASAPYQATKCLQQLAKDEQKMFPKESLIVLNDFYVDDLLSGASSQCEALALQSNLIKLTSAGGFELRKWASNDPALLQCLPLELRATSETLSLDCDKTIKTLGVQWHPASDTFSFSVVVPQVRTEVTKRQLISDLAKVFDPLGWLAPTTITGKILFQALWKIDLGWDDPLPKCINEEWDNYVLQLPSIELLKIDRCIVFSENASHQLHGFCDASEKAYAAAVYLRSMDSNGSTKVQLVAAKTKVAPIKTISLPRLELCGALLLIKLARMVLEAWDLNISEVHCWTDSTIVLSWLASSPHRWKTFVANRVTEIQEFKCSWHHVQSEDNPADCASRGISPEYLVHHPLWWHGPQWLQQDISTAVDVTAQLDKTALPEERTQALATHVITDTTLLEKFSSLSTLQRVTAYCLRFIHNARTIPADRLVGNLSTKELDRALLRWIVLAQGIEFHAEINCLQDNKPLPKQSKLLSLNPFMDSLGILRVGGRLRHSHMPMDRKHPILLPHNHTLTRLIATSQHIANLHAGPQLMLASLQQRYWIIRGRDLVRHIVKQCIVCHRQHAKLSSQMMGDLPAARITPCRPFLNCGVDYAGPFTIRVLKGRGQKSFKGYVALFVCFATKAIHLELVSDLSTNAFIAALKRFVGRRGKPSNMYSDCGTNFVGADNELQDFVKLAKSVKHNDQVTRHLGNEGIQWHFNPPSAPHFGGLWEAGVKSVKHHLRRIVGEVQLNFEDLLTVLVQIEACLNSRPLTPCSSDPNDLEVLTPGHFLIGCPLTAVPEPDYAHIKVGHLSKWQLIQKLTQDFWKRWTSEYLVRLQQRPKWKDRQPNLRCGDLVLMKDERLPPMQWKLGRVTVLHPGDDGLVRTVTLKTSNGQVKRPVVKLSPLPVSS